MRKGGVIFNARRYLFVEGKEEKLKKKGSQEENEGGISNFEKGGRKRPSFYHVQGLEKNPPPPTTGSGKEGGGGGVRYFFTVRRGVRIR